MVELEKMTMDTFFLGACLIVYFIVYIFVFNLFKLVVTLKMSPLRRSTVENKWPPRGTALPSDAW